MDVRAVKPPATGRGVCRAGKGLSSWKSDYRYRGHSMSISKYRPAGGRQGRHDQDPIEQVAQSLLAAKGQRKGLKAIDAECARSSMPRQISPSTIPSPTVRLWTDVYR